MTPLQRQAVLVCVVCALAALLTIGITLTLLKRGKGETPAVPDGDSVTTDAPAGSNDLADHYQIDNTSSALLTETADAGQSYQEETLFLGDSNTVRLYNNGLISLQQFCAKEGIGTQVALHEGIVTFKKDSNSYTIAQAVAMMKPRRVVITLGTNDTGMEVADFINNYTALVQAIRESYPYTDIIVNTIPPIPADHSTYPHMDQAKIDDMNMALLSMCEQLGLKFLNTAETLKGDDGYGKADYYTSGDIHLKSAGLKAALNYLRTHACESTDNRPDTNNIPIRTLEYVSNPSSAVQAPSSEAASESTSSSVEAVHYEARYQVDKNGGGFRERIRQDFVELQHHRCKPDRQCDGCARRRACLRQVERRRDQQDPHGHEVQAEPRCDRRLRRRVGGDQQRGQGPVRRLLYLPRKNQRQVRQQRYDPLVRQRRGG